MKIYTIAFTRQGARLQEDVKTALQSMPEADVKTHLTPRLMERLRKEVAAVANQNETENLGHGAIQIQEAGLEEFTQQAFENADQIIYIGAAGIAVRAIAPYLESKDTDPGVIVIDELGKFVIPILSGHIGGANDMAKMLAKMLGSAPAITTATDINGCLAIDTWAVNHNMKVANIENIKHISAAVLENQEIGIYTDSKSAIIKSQIEELQSLYGNFVKLDSLDEDLKGYQKLENLVVISNHADSGLRAGILHLIPMNIFAGIGCRKNKAPEDVEKLFLDTLKELKLDIRSLNSINTVDLKKDEEALLELSRKYGKKLNIYTAQELLKAEAYTAYGFSESELVKRTTGVGNICERSAVIGAGNFIKALNPRVRSEQKNSADKSVKSQEKEYDCDYMEITMLKTKTKKDGVTIAVAILN